MDDSNEYAAILCSGFVGSLDERQYACLLCVDRQTTQQEHAVIAQPNASLAKGLQNILADIMQWRSIDSRNAPCRRIIFPAGCGIG